MKLTNKIRREIIAAYQQNHDEMVMAMTDYPQETLDKFTAKYGITLHAEDELPVITYLNIRLKQGHDLEALLAEKVCLKHSPAKHSGMFAQHASRDTAAVEAGETRQVKP